MLPGRVRARSCILKHMKWLKVGAVVFGAIAVTALGIDAADTVSGSRTTLLGQLISSQPVHACPAGMVEAPMAQSFKCVDAYEASAGGGCPHADPSNVIETKENLDSSACKAGSNANARPWTFITREQAMTACVKEGKRLPSSNEWYLVSVGTPDDPHACNIDSGSLSDTGSHQSCVSAIGAQDVIGNAWEWVSDDVINGQYQGRALPENGYVTQVDANGVAVLTDASQPSEIFYKDYFWGNKDGAYGIIRGGFYGNKTDAGVYAVHADTPPTTAGTAIGFRCVQ